MRGDYLSIKTIAELSISSIAVIISVVALIKTSIDNKKMIEANNKILEENSRPYISIYTETLIANRNHFYIVIRNFGNTNAFIKEFKIDEKTKEMIKIGNKDYFSHLVNSQLAPGQSITHLVHTKIKDYDDEHISDFDITYSSSHKTYTEKFKFNLTINSKMPSIGLSTADYDKQFIELYQDEIRKKL